MKPASVLVALLAIVGLLAPVIDRAEAYTVAGWGKKGFADFSKAIVFDTTTNQCPSNAETIQGSSSNVRSCAIPMTPVGDGSWVCTAVVIKGVNYSYWFEYRIPVFDSTTVYTDSTRTYAWKNGTNTQDRAQDQSQQRTITVPATATGGYIFYNIYGDPDVRGKQGFDVTGSWDTELTVANPDVAQYNGSDDVSSSGDNDTTNLGGNNAYSVTATQTGDTSVQIGWRLKITGGDAIVPHIEGAREFDTTSAYTPYGFRILRARLPANWKTDTTNPGHLRFEDTIVNVVTGDTLFSPNRPGGSYYDGVTTFTDTSIPANTSIGDSFVYTVLWVDAYGLGNDTGNQNFAGGAASWIRSGAVTVIFLVEKFDPDVVFPDGATEGMIYLTPYVDGIPQGMSIKARAILASRKSS